MADGKSVAEENGREDPAYPEALARSERELLRVRQGAAGETDLRPAVGFGLSGGGIRSATFCLGVFQGLAKRRLLSSIDYLSTVSGGGYFGAFYGRLFTRPQVASIEDVEEILAPRAAADEEEREAVAAKLPRGKVFRWLRENGRYLAPSGSGDVLLGGAAMMRNFLAVHFVLAAFVLMIFLAAQLVRGGIEVACNVGEAGQCRWWGWLQNALMNTLPGGKGGIWWSPYAALAGAVFLFFAVPPAWCYWLVEKPDRRTAGSWIPPFYGWLAAFALSLIAVAASSPPLAKFLPFRIDPGFYWPSLLVLAVALETMIWGLASGYVPRFHQPAAPNEKAIFDDEKVRLRVSLQLKTALAATGAALAFAVIDSLAQTVYGAVLLGQFRPEVWLAAVLGPLVGLGGFGRKLLLMFGGENDGKRFSLPLNLAAAAGAFALAAILLIGLDAAAQAIAWKGKMPLGPRPNWDTTARVSEATQIAVRPSAPETPKPQACAGPMAAVPAAGAPEVSGSAVPGGWQIAAERPPRDDPECGRRSREDLYLPLSAFSVTFLFSFLFGWSWPFLNRSTHQPLYTSRLIRAYLGASNPGRLTPAGKAVTQAIPGDDIKQEDYWPRFGWLRGSEREGAGPRLEEIRAAERSLFEKGMPLHLVNVTINETLDARSQVEQRDRKGIGMAIGPASISAGVHHHLVMATDGEGSRPEKLSAQVYPEQRGDEAPYQIFRYASSSGRDRIDFNGEFLTLGNWTGISGAAFSTSLGWRTSLGLSLLAGIANVRLTYWWNSGVKPLDRIRTRAARARTTAQRRVAGALRAQWLAPAEQPPPLPETSKRWWRRSLSSLLQLFFTVQVYLFDELLARYHGTARQWWPLSDGGHFENLGGYELIRRKLPVMVIVDAEADPEYTLEGLANLIRKARLDFGAEIRFFTEEELDREVDPAVRKNFGTLEQLRRGFWVEEPVKDPSAPDRGKKAASSGRLSINPAKMEALSLAHAALAEVTYSGREEKSMLVYLKPTLIGDESVDVHRYHSEHPAFPHETTLQQFFDEAQWESYRKLGEHIALKIFQEPPNPEPGKLLPYHFLRHGRGSGAAALPAETQE